MGFEGKLNYREFWKKKRIDGVRGTIKKKIEYWIWEISWGLSKDLLEKSETANESVCYIFAFSKKMLDYMTSCFYAYVIKKYLTTNS